MKRKIPGSTSYAVVALLAVCLCIPRYADAIPAFSRAHGLTCSTCHTVFPQLNEYGEVFLKNAYVYSGKDGRKEPEPPVRVSPPPVSPPVVDHSHKNDIKGEGDPGLLEKLRGGVLVSTDAPLPVPVRPPVPGGSAEGTSRSASRLDDRPSPGGVEQVPISFAASLQGTYDRNAVTDLDMSTRALTLMAGGTIKEKAGYFGTFRMYSEAKVAGTAETPKNDTAASSIGELFLVWRSLMELPINVKLGRFQPKLGLWKTSHALSSASPYAPHSYTLNSLYNAPFSIDQPQDALEANMIIADRLFVAGGVVSRKNQSDKEWYVHSSVKFGGADFHGNRVTVPQGGESIADTLSLTIGGYGYVGTSGEPDAAGGSAPRRNDYYRAGSDMDLIWSAFRLKLSGVVGRDDNPPPAYAGSALTSCVAAVEGEYTFWPGFIGALRFEYIDDGREIYRRFVPVFVYAPLEQVKIAADYRHEYGATRDARVGTLGVVFSF